MTRELGEENQQIPEQFGVPYQILERPGDYDQEIPYLKRTIGLVNQYEGAKPKGRESLLEQQAIAIVRDPKILVPTLDNLDLIAQLRPSIFLEEVRTELLSHLEHQVTRKSGLKIWTPNRIEDLTRLCLDVSGPNSIAIQTMEAQLFNAPQSVNDAIDFQYNAAWAMVATSSQDIRKELFSILCLERPWFNETSAATLYFNLGLHALDDLHLGRYHTVMYALDKIGVFLETSATESEIAIDSIRTWNRMHHIGGAVSKLSPEDFQKFQIIARQMQQANPLRWSLLTEVYENEEYQAPIATGLFNYLEVEADMKAYRENFARAKWPHNIIDNLDEPLRVLVDHTFSSTLSKFFHNFPIKI